MKAVVDRFEGAWAVLEVQGKMMWNVPRDFLPSGTSEGTMVEFNFAISKDSPDDNSLFEEIFE
ncbi:DUF3006 domain-containing protein [Desulforamulus reducens]|uniref:DUF3006 domain-containing protein n=1 Tax=Desulforamulus reducens TaxID=59610 RepID=UPI0003162CC1|nr:DUF3006 domain-containing protein [Desulforamulus reducens]